MRVLLTLVLLTATAAADQVTLKNGDRLSGTIVKSDAKSLTLKSEFAGTVAIDWTAVTGITSTAPLYVALKSGQVLVGPVTAEAGTVRVNTSETGTVSTSQADITGIRSGTEEQAYEKLQNPGLLDLWTGYVDTGLAMSRGNSDTTTFNVGFNATRTTKRDVLSAYFTSLYAKNRVAGITSATAEAIRGGVRYDFNISDRVFGFGFTDEQYDKFQHLDLRAIVGGGVGDHLIKTDRTIFDLFGGGSLDKEFYTTLTRTSGEALVGEELTHKIRSEE